MEKFCLPFMSLLLLGVNKKILVTDGHNAFILYIYLYVMPRTELSTSHMLGKHTTTEPQHQPLGVKFVTIKHVVRMNLFCNWSEFCIGILASDLFKV